MAKTIQNNLNGITAYWRTNRLSNVAMEGFNNKIRWLMRQAYGYRDEEYFHLKIYDLPEIKTQKELQQLCNKTQKRLKNGTANTKTLEIQTLIEYCFYYSRLPMKKTFFGGNGNATFCRFCGIYSKRYFTEINPQILVKTQKKKQLNHDYCGSTAYSVFINWPN